MLNMLALVVSLEQILPVLVTTIIFVLLGLLIFAIAFIIIIYVSPFSVKKEIEEDQNTSLGIIIGSVILGIAIIIAAAIHG
jgi:putative membrane protein